MKIRVIYHPQSEQARPVEEYMHELQRLYGVEPELISLETREGAEMAKLYDVTRYPAILAVRDSGELAEAWVGDQLPLMNDVLAYANSQG